jgi:catechol 2,3-dioxygenase-like lactoylglutathione lyase family enzyme
MLSVTDVEAASTWYQRVLGLTSGHGGAAYEQLFSNQVMVLQLHADAVGHHHGPIGDPGGARGNGVAVWFEADDFDELVGRARAEGATVQTDVHLNPNAGRRELWLRDPDGFLVVLAEPYA